MTKEAGIFTGPQIRNFIPSMNHQEKQAWLAYVVIQKNMLGNTKSADHKNKARNFVSGLLQLPERHFPEKNLPEKKVPQRTLSRKYVKLHQNKKIYLKPTFHKSNNSRIRRKDCFSDWPTSAPFHVWDRVDFWVFALLLNYTGARRS